MDREDQRRYFVVGSVFMEIVTPLFRQKLVNDYTNKGLRSIHDFINSQTVIHILFHLRHRNSHCCQDQVHCYNSPALPVNYSQWDLLYTENPGPGPGPHNCHCKFTANQINLDDLDITLASLILLNCCNLGLQEENVVRKLRHYKNDYLSHNTKGQITETEYNTLWTDIESFILQLDPSKGDDLIRIEQRPLDQPLCDKYLTCLLDLYKKLDEMDTKLDHQTELLQEIHDVLGNQTTKNTSLFIRGLSSLLKLFRSKQQDNLLPAQPKLGQSLFTLYHHTDLTSKVGNDSIVSDIVMMDGGRLVMCVPDQNRLLICNTDGSQVDSIPVQGMPWHVTAVNNSTVAVTLLYSTGIEMYDIHNKLKLKSISPPGMWCWGSGITTINNKLVVGGNNRLQIVDHQTGEVVQTIQTNCDSYRLHCSDDRIFYTDYKNKLYWLSYTDDRHHTLTLPSGPRSMTTLQDGSLYVVCEDKSVQHVSSDGKQYKQVKTLQLNSLCDGIQYNLTQRKLVIKHNNHVTVYSEI
ncbi:uncharacterized protein [Mytilus edulis]|uniref:uncharacterized protein n=1 Tax=Mytilus edulis TaxID=6550 RepID=UPI0039EE49AA